MIDRIVYLNSSVDVTMAFMEAGVPVIPSDPAVYPLWMVKDPMGNVVDFGVGTFNAGDNLFHASWAVPEDAPLSKDTAKWSIDWDVLSNTNIRYKSTEYFDCAHPDFDATSVKEQQKLILSTVASSLSVPVPGTPSNISFSVTNLQGDQVWTPSAGNEPANKGMYGDYYIYTVTVPANTLQGNTQYLGIWQIELGGSTSTFIVKIFGASPYELSLVSDLRAFLDKALKPNDLIIGYKDSELLNFIYRGLDTLNQFPPPSNWTLSDINNLGLNSILILAAAWWGLDVQYLAEADSMFDYSGQSISLTSDRTGFIESEKSRIWEYLDGTFKIQKKNLARQGAAGGSQGGYGSCSLGISLPTTGGGGIAVKIPMPLIIGS